MRRVAPRRDGVCWVSEGRVRTGMNLEEVEQRLRQVCHEHLYAPRDLEVRQQPRGFQVDFIMRVRSGSRIRIEWRLDPGTGRPHVHFVVSSCPAHTLLAVLSVFAFVAIAWAAGGVSSNNAVPLGLGVAGFLAAADVYAAARNSTRAANDIAKALGVHPMAALGS